MKLDRVVSFLDKWYDIRLLFSPGIYNKFDNSDREYFDELNLKGSKLFYFLNNYLKYKLEDLLGDRFYVCLVFYSEDERGSDLSDKIQLVKECGINIPSDYVSVNRYIEDYEVYCNYFFYEESVDNLSKYISGTLAIDLMEGIPRLPCDAFYIKRDMTKVVNVYDDRGMDVVNLYSHKII